MCLISDSGQRGEKNDLHRNDNFTCYCMHGVGEMTEPREYIVPLSEDEAFYGFKDVATPLIRCKDCKHWYCYGDETWCSELGIYGTNKESYCSYAKREEK